MEQVLLNIWHFNSIEQMFTVLRVYGEIKLHPTVIYRLFNGNTL